MTTPLTPEQLKRIPLFPLGTVLFPGGLLPLKIFEQRYLDMTKACLRDNLPFGVCLIREGHEVGTPAAPYNVGCLARIEQWDMPQPNMFHLLARGGERFRVVQTSVADDGLISGEIELLPAAEPCSADAEIAALVKRVIDRADAVAPQQPAQLDDGVWVAYRLAEMLPAPMSVKQELLEAAGVDTWIYRIKNIIKSNT